MASIIDMIGQFFETVLKLVSRTLFKCLESYSYKYDTKYKAIYYDKLQKIFWEAVNFALAQFFSGKNFSEIEVLLKPFIENKINKDLLRKGKELIVLTNSISNDEQVNYKLCCSPDVIKNVTKKFHIRNNLILFKDEIKKDKSLKKEAYNFCKEFIYNKIISKPENNKNIISKTEKVSSKNKKKLAEVNKIKKKKKKKTTENEDSSTESTESANSESTDVKSKPKKTSKNKSSKVNKKKKTNKEDLPSDDGLNPNEL